MRPGKIIAIILSALFFSCQNKKQTVISISPVPQTNDSLVQARKFIDSLRAQNSDMKEELGYWFSEYEIDEIRAKGIADPLNYISNDLMNNPQLIPYEGVLGGTMRFWKVTLIGNKWAIAYFEDGHIAGKGLYKFTINKDRSVKWTIIDHYLE
jgi:hypothetical protein